MKPLRIAYLYPAEMNIYGDRGNVIVLEQRCRWRGIKTQLDEIHLGESYDFSDADIVFGGGGQDKGQEIVAADLYQRRHRIKTAAKAGLPMLVICGLYQLFGVGFTTAEGKHLAGIGLFDATTIAGTERMIGNIVIESPFGRLVGFENHSGETELGESQSALGKVISGAGNNPSSGQEGAIRHNAIGTYLHGPILPKNPSLADFLIETALKRRSSNAKLKSLDDSLEHQTAEFAAKLRR